MPKRVPPEVRSKGMCTVALMSCSQASFPENQARTAEERGTDFQELSDEFEPNRGKDSAHEGDDDNDTTGICLARGISDFTVSLRFSPTYAFPSFRCLG